MSNLSPQIIINPHTKPPFQAIVPGILPLKARHMVVLTILDGTNISKDLSHNLVTERIFGRLERKSGGVEME